MVGSFHKDYAPLFPMLSSTSYIRLTTFFMDSFFKAKSHDEQICLNTKFICKQHTMNYTSMILLNARPFLSVGRIDTYLLTANMQLKSKFPYTCIRKPT